MQYGCIGEKLTHSFSREIHSRLFDYDYRLCEIPKDKLNEFMLKKDFKAINVTIPYKQSVIPYLDFVSDTAKAIGAVNTIVNKDGLLYGYNTDFSGLSALIKKQGIEMQNKKVIILGSGGTSKTAVAVANALGAREVYRVSRSAREDCITYEQMYALHLDADIIINTTPCGMFPDIMGSPVDIDRFSSLSGVVDAIYNPLRSNLVAKAQEKGISATGGLYMLVAQGVFAAELFMDTKIPQSETDRVYSEILRQKRNIVLTGMPSSGKTTIGKILAEKLDMEFIDCDEQIVNEEGKQITEIFARFGEKAFRDIESRVIESVSAKQGCVISTGGGAVLREKNVLALKGNGVVYFIDRPLEKLVPTGDRPLSSNTSDLEKRYRERYPIYKSTADKIIANNTTAIAAADKIKEDFQ